MNNVRFKFLTTILLGSSVASLSAQVTSGASRGNSISVKDYGARGGVRQVTDAAVLQGMFALTSATAAFTSGDAGKTVEVNGAGRAGGQLVTTIVSVNNETTVTLGAAAEKTVTEAGLIIAADDFEPIKRAIAAAVKSGATLQLPKDTYYTHSGWVINGPLKIAGNGARLLFSIHGLWDTPEGLHFESPTELKFLFTGVLKKGTTAVKLMSTAGLRPGREVMLVLGTDTYDATQPYVSQFNRVASIAGNLVTLTSPIPEEISGMSHSLITFSRIAENIVIEDLVFDTPPHSMNTVDMPLYLYRTRNVRISNVQMNYVPNGIAVLNSDHVSVENFRAQTVAGNNSALNLIETYNFTGRGVDVENNTAPVGIRMETQNRGVMLERIFIGSERPSAGLIGIQAYGHSTGVAIKNYHFKPFEREKHVVIPLQIGEESEVRSQNMYLETSPSGSAQDLTEHYGELQYEGNIYREIRSDAFRLPLKPNMTNVGIPVPDGITKAIRFFTKDKTGITAIKALCGGCGGAFANDLFSGLPPAGVLGSLKGVNWVASVGPQFVFNENVSPFSLRGKSIRVTTGPNVPHDDYLSLEIEYYPLPSDWRERLEQAIATALFLLAASVVASRWLRTGSLRVRRLWTLPAKR